MSDTFAANVDVFAATLDPEEQAMLIRSLGDEAEVQAFGAMWPGLQTLGVWKAPAGTEAGVLMSGGSTMVVSASDELPDSNDRGVG